MLQIFTIKSSGQSVGHSTADFSTEVHELTVSETSGTITGSAFLPPSTLYLPWLTAAPSRGFQLDLFAVAVNEASVTGSWIVSTSTMPVMVLAL